MPILLAISDAIDRLLALIAGLIGWLFLVLVAVICFDIITRKVGYQLPGFGSTPIQELEWHLHGLLFMGWLGYAYVRNVHVRIDVFTGHRPERTQAKIEVIGILIFAIPYCLVAVWFAYIFAQTSFLQNESSDAPNGLPHRWILKSALFISLVLLLLSVISVLFRRLGVIRGAVPGGALPPAQHG
ncbi:MAG: TRAP transporter small permease subunit [Roseomonas sp.]|nr:TRAP transporter small permease subunit [Roseomonas sp.]MBX9699147.1 TRAP transporter small permease subunit [Acetobacteraceae bacterium]